MPLDIIALRNAGEFLCDLAKDLPPHVAPSFSGFGTHLRSIPFDLDESALDRKDSGAPSRAEMVSTFESWAVFTEGLCNGTVTINGSSSVTTIISSLGCGDRCREIADVFRATAQDLRG